MEVFNINTGIVEARTIAPEKQKQSSGKAFIEANTIEMSLAELRDEHIIPVFSATNEPLISHHEIIDCVSHITQVWFNDEVVFQPSIRVSHPVMGRIPDAKHKRASELLPWEQTLYYERMMFCIEIPSISREINGNTLSLTVGGVKSFSTDNLYGKRPRGEQQIQLFIGFKNHVCCNLCVSTDGAYTNGTVRSIPDLVVAVEQLFQNYNYRSHLEMIQKLSDIKVTESEFAQFIGKTRLYRYLPEERKASLVPMLFGDQQLGAVAKDYFTDANFNADLDTGEIDLWRIYNLLTGVNKSTYIDQFIPRAINAQEIVIEMAQHKTGAKQSWYMD
jgi:hypothetical protein